MGRTLKINGEEELEASLQQLFSYIEGKFNYIQLVQMVRDLGEQLSRDIPERDREEHVNTLLIVSYVLAKECRPGQTVEIENN